MISEPVIRVATEADLIAYYGEPPRRSIRAFVAVLDGVPVGIAGLAYQGPSATPYYFSEMKPEMARFKKAIFRGSRAFLRTFPARCPAICSDPKAVRFLKRLGFVPAGFEGGRELLIYAGPLGEG